MKLLIVGARGQVGWELARSLQALGEVITADRRTLDLADPAGLAVQVKALAPDVIVNAGAYTAVDRAEQEEALATRVNGESVGELARVARELGALFVHYSTDYVFDGTGQGLYAESAPTAPINAYGRSKLAGEQAAAAAGGDWLVFRTTWVYASRGANFARTILRLAGERERLSVVADQVGAPTSARFLADATALIISRAQLERAQGRFASGLFNLAAGGSTSWQGFAQALVDGARLRGAELKVGEIAGIPASEYPTPARRPANSRLDLGRLEARFGVRPPDWRVGVDLVLDELYGAV